MGTRTLETLNFDNQALERLPIDPEKKNYVRTVENATFSLVEPAPLDNPRVVATCWDALKLLGLSEKEEERPEFVEYFSGNKRLPGSRPAAHCYCGYQFGNFAGQLGDGAAMYLGEVVNEAGERWELQFKGSGPTPYSRQADGRKVLRSSIREFLCSEAMHNLGIPTTRAGTIVTSDTKVVRDVFYTGNPIQENCTVITRIAPTFFRFGSFEVAKTEDPVTGRPGSSPGNTDLVRTLADYTLEMFYPHIHATDADAATKFTEMYREICVRTARLVAKWQAVGWCHGVLNTDNMSIIGLTIDYGPFGFLDRYDPDHICNHSDDGGRYDYKSQPAICEWNLNRLAEDLSPLTDKETLDQICNETFKREYTTAYRAHMRAKLGLTHTAAAVESATKSHDGDGDDDDDSAADGDDRLFVHLFNVMADTGADFTNTFRLLSLVSPENRGAPFLSAISEHLTTVDEWKRSIKPRMDPRQLQQLLALPQIAQAFGVDRGILSVEMRKYDQLKKLTKMTQAEKETKDRELWGEWLMLYCRRLQTEQERSGLDHDAFHHNKQQAMDGVNPAFILRNFVAQHAIDLAEKGDYSEVQRVLSRLQHPYTQPEGEPLQKPPAWACALGVSCSS